MATGTTFRPQPMPAPDGPVGADFDGRSPPPEASPTLIFEIGTSVMPSPRAIGAPTDVFASTSSRT